MLGGHNYDAFEKVDSTVAGNLKATAAWQQVCFNSRTDHVPPSSCACSVAYARRLVGLPVNLTLNVI